MMTEVTIYGGLKIGGNKILVEDKENRIMLDFGKSYSRVNYFYGGWLDPRFKTYLRDMITIGDAPRLNGIYRKDSLEIPESKKVIDRLGDKADYLMRHILDSYEQYNKKHGKPFLDAVFLTHGHKDHCEYISFLHPEIPVYCSEETMKVLETIQETTYSGTEKNAIIKVPKKELKEKNSKYFPGELTVDNNWDKSRERNFKVFDYFDEIDIGSIKVKPYPVNHSIPGATSYMVKTSDKSIYYTGDLRLGNRTNKSLEKIKETEPDLMITEGTKVDRKEDNSEETVYKGIVEEIEEIPERLTIVSFTWSNVKRYETMKKVAEKTGRVLVIPPKLAYLLHKMGDSIENEDNVESYVKRRGSYIYSKLDYTRAKHELGYAYLWNADDKDTIRTEHYENGVRAYQINKNEGKYIVVLPFWQFGQLLDILPEEGGKLILSKAKPFDNKTKQEEKLTKHWIERFGLNKPKNNVIYHHNSGHSDKEDLKKIVDKIKPKKIVPIHTTNAEEFTKWDYNVQNIEKTPEKVNF